MNPYRSCAGACAGPPWSTPWKRTVVKWIHVRKRMSLFDVLVRSRRIVGALSVLVVEVLTVSARRKMRNHG